MEMYSNFNETVTERLHLPLNGHGEIAVKINREIPSRRTDGMGDRG